MKRFFCKGIEASAFFVFLMILVIPVHTKPTSLKFVKVYFPDGDSVTAELAVTFAERASGLMFRKRLDLDQGMLFIFDEEDIHSFWMKNMIIPLDILWLDAERRIVHIERCVPPCQEEPCPTYTSKIPAMYVLELKAGSVEQRGLKLFDRLDFILPSLENFRLTNFKQFL